MKANTLFYSLISLAMFASCKHKNPFMEAKDADLTVQVMPLPATPDDSNTISYKARVIPDKQLMESKTREEKNALYYKMDSCFYINSAQGKNYAVMVQPIANGVSGTYEYLLQFESAPKVIDSINLVYQDKYINKKAYRLKIANNN